MFIPDKLLYLLLTFLFQVSLFSSWDGYGISQTHILGLWQIWELKQHRYFTFGLITYKKHFVTACSDSQTLCIKHGKSLELSLNKQTVNPDPTFINVIQLCSGWARSCYYYFFLWFFWLNKHQLYISNNIKSHFSLFVSFEGVSMWLRFCLCALRLHCFCLGFKQVRGRWRQKRRETIETE